MSIAAVKQVVKKAGKFFLRHLPYLITTAIAAGAFYISWTGEKSTNRLNDAQNRQIMQLERTTPTGTITKMKPYPPRAHTAILTHLRRDPLLLHQIYNVFVTASNVPDNGSLFIDVHDYGERTSAFNQTLPRFYLVPVHPKPPWDTAVDQRWEADGVYIGTKAVPSKVISYRLSLYFCNSVDSKKISTAIKKPAIKNYGLPYLSYPSCRQLDSIFVRRGT